VLRPVIAEVRKRFPAVAVAETGGTELYRRAEIGVAVVSGTAANCTQMLDQCVRLVAGRTEIELLSARRRLFSDEDSPARRPPAMAPGRMRSFGPHVTTE